MLFTRRCYHNLEVPVRKLGNQILRGWEQWCGQLDLPTRACHGDLKISNLHFRSLEQGICLLDLDTLGPGDYSIEMGDAWRSWCNPAGESNLEQTYFDLSLFEASANGWLAEMKSITAEEKKNLISGIERICLELSARFKLMQSITLTLKRIVHFSLKLDNTTYNVLEHNSNLLSP